MAVNVDELFIQIERLRKAAIGEPLWLDDKGAFEFPECSPRIVAVLKLVRAAHGISALRVLCEAGLFIDAGAIMRCTLDCTDEVWFLLEEYPRASQHVWQFVKAFFESTIDGYAEGETPAVETKKIRSAVVRILKGRNDDATQKLMKKIFRTFSGYVHANYAHIMEVYNGATRDFNLRGVPSEKQRKEKSEYVDVAAESVRLCAQFVAQVFGMKELEEAFAKLAG
jgi:hypothetical protein